MKIKFTYLLVMLALVAGVDQLAAQGTAFTYQGQLNNSGGPASGAYNLKFSLFNTHTNGLAIAGPVTNNAVEITNGLFSVQVDFGPVAFAGSNWLEIAVESEGAGSFTTLTPRQQLTPTPNAVFASTAGDLSGPLPAGNLSGTYGNAVNLNKEANNFAGSFTGNGAGVTNVNAGTLGGLASSNYWQTGGNSGTSPTIGNFLGTADSQPLELWVNGQRALRIEPDTNNFGAPNVIGGAPNNYVDPGITGATIAGGGVLNYTATNGYETGPGSNHVSAIWGTISGGRRNTVAADHSDIAGGHDNLIQSFAYDSAIGGGSFNTISNSSEEAVIAGGYGNFIQSYAFDSAIAGGSGNTIANFAQASLIAGGYSNVVQSYADDSAIGGGSGNTIANFAEGSLIAGGDSNTAGGTGETVGGGLGNTIPPVADGSTIAGGWSNLVEAIAFDNNLGGYNSTIAGGLWNIIASPYATIGGGSYHYIGTNCNSGTIGGGYGNYIADNTFDSTIGGGSYGSIGTNSFASTIGGGRGNSIGSNATASTIPGGQNNIANGSYSFAVGQNAQANHTGAFIWSDASSLSPFSSVTQNEFAVRALGGVRFVTGGAGMTLNGLAVPLPQATVSDSNHLNIVNVVEGSSANLAQNNVYGGTIAGGGATDYNGLPGANFVTADFGTVGGGLGDVVNNGFGTVAGGAFNITSGGYGTVGGGSHNSSGYEATIPGGAGNNAVGNYSAIGGGLDNLIPANGAWAVVGGGQSNSANAEWAVIGGGEANTNSEFDSVIGGGQNNFIEVSADHAFIGGGGNNLIAGSAAAVYSTIGGGQFNAIQTNAGFGSIGGGYGNTIASSSQFGTIAGGCSNAVAGLTSFAAGFQAQANNDGTFVWADSQDAPFASTDENQFLIRAAGGVGINTSNPAGAALNVAGTVKATAFQGDGSGLFNVSSGALGNYVFAYDNALQSIATANTYQDINFAADAQINGWTHTAGTPEYTNAQPGLYLIQYNAQLSTVGPGTNATLHATVNATEIPGSRASVTISAASELVPVSKSLIASLNAADVLTLQFSSTGTGVRLTGTSGISMTITRIQ